MNEKEKEEEEWEWEWEDDEISAFHETYGLHRNPMHKG